MWVSLVFFCFLCWFFFLVEVLGGSLHSLFGQTIDVGGKPWVFASCQESTVSWLCLHPLFSLHLILPQ